MRKKEIMALASTLQAQWDKLKTNEAFLLLKEEEVRRGSEFAYVAWVQSLEQCRMEKGLLLAHAGQLQAMMDQEGITPPPEIEKLIARIYAPPGVRVY